VSGQVFTGAGEALAPDAATWDEARDHAFQARADRDGRAELEAVPVGVVVLQAVEAHEPFAMWRGEGAPPVAQGTLVLEAGRSEDVELRFP
jgi:hypothetical protein